MDSVTSAQYLNMKASFSRQGIDIDVAYRQDGRVDYIYAVGRLLAVDRDVLGVPLRRVSKSEVALTMVDGRVVHRA